MANPHLNIDPDDCSDIGLLLLEYIGANEVTFTQLANRVDISRAALRVACLKQGNPGKKTIPKLALVLDRTESELCQLVCMNKVKQLSLEEEKSILEALESFVKILEQLPVKKDISEYDLYHHALRAVTKFF